MISRIFQLSLLCSLLLCFTQVLQAQSSCAVRIGYNYTTSNTVNLFAIGSGAGGSGIYYDWYIKDATIGHVINATETVGNYTHTFSNSNANYVCVTMYDDAGCSATYCEYVSPNANNSGCRIYPSYSVSGNTVTINTMRAGGGQNPTYDWFISNFGGTPFQVTNSNPSITRTLAANGGNAKDYFCVTMSDSSAAGSCQNTHCDTIQLNGVGAGSCDISATYTVAGNTANFTATSSNLSATVYSWEIRDYATGMVTYNTTTNPNYSYTFSSTNTIHYACVTAYDSLTNSCQTTFCDTVDLSSGGAGSNCQVTYTYVDSGNTVDFVATGTGSNLVNPIYDWYIVDNGNITNFSTANPNYTHTFSGLGNNNYACVTLYDSLSTCQATFCDTLQLSSGTGNNCAGVSARYNYTVSSGGVVSFYATTVGFDTLNTVYLWNFGATGTNPQATLSPGWTSICLTVDDSICVYTYCDSVYVSPSSSCTDNEVQLILNHDNYGNETAWDVVDAAGQIVASGSSNIALSNTTVVETLCLPTGCYTLNVYDSWGDGMCCNYGFGGYTLVDSVGMFSISGGSFGHVDSRNFCVGGATTPCGDLAFTTISYNLGANGTATFSTSTPGNVQPTLYNWLVDGVSASTAANPTLTLSNGIHDVCLSATDSSGNCSVIVCDSILISNGTTGPQGCAGIVGDMNVTQDPLDPFLLYVQPVLNNVPQNSSFIFYWSFGDNSGGFGGQTSHNYNNYGSYNLCYVAIDSSNGCIVNYCDTITLDSSGNFSRFVGKPGFNVTTLAPILNTVLSTDQIAATAWTAQVFPNPAGDFINLEINSSERLEAQVRIVSAAGQVMQQRTLNDNLTEISVANLPAGVYFVRLETETAQQTLKFVKQ
jgi:hypothetical protein